MKVVSVGTMWSGELAAALDPGVAFEAVTGDDIAARDAALRDADVVVSATFDAAMARACTRLRLLVCPAAGTERIDRAALPATARLVNGAGHEIPMAEYAIGSLVALRQHLKAADAGVRRGEWRFGYNAKDHRVVEELFGSTLGMVGFGRIGREVALRAGAFGMRCAAVTLHPERAREGQGQLEFLGALGERADVDRLVAWSDHLVLCCELSPLTQGLVDARRLALMKPNAILVNIARGPIAVEQDLYDALSQRRIGGAVLDVWYRYPAPGERREPSTAPFAELDNVLLTPHSSGWTAPALQRRLAAMARAINDFAKSEST